MRFLLLFFISPALFAADWVALPPIPNGDLYFYDSSKLVIKEEEITYWKKVQFKAPQVHKGSEVVSGILRETIHCGEHAAKLLTYLYYSPTGETVEYVTQDESPPAPIVPDTVGDVFDRILCPMVWRKQEETRIKSEQKAAEIEAKMSKETPKAKEENKATPAAPAVSAPSAAPSETRPATRSPIQKPIAPRANNIAPPKAVKPTHSDSDTSQPDAARNPPNVRLPDKVDKPTMQLPLPEPQILEQLY